MRTQASEHPARLSEAGRVHLHTPSGEPLEAVLATGRRLRLIGLAGLRVAPRAGLLIPHCRAVHTWGMRFRLDVVFLEWRSLAGVALVTDAREEVRPCRFVVASGESRPVAAIELASGSARRLGLTRAGAAVTVDWRWRSTCGC